jgi:hypothetical protein
MTKRNGVFTISSSSVWLGQRDKCSRTNRGTTVVRNAVHDEAKSNCPKNQPKLLTEIRNGPSCGSVWNRMAGLFAEFLTGADNIVQPPRLAQGIDK